MGRGSHGHSHSHHGHSHGDGSDHHHSSDEKAHRKLSNQSNGHGHSHGGGGHGHSHGGGDESNSKFCGCCYLSNRVRISSMLGMTFFFFLVELIIGQVTKSIALTTDSFHMLSDSLALVIGLFSIIISSKKTTKNTFGWVRAEILGALVNAVFLVSVCLGILIEAIERLFEQKHIHEPKLLLLVGCIGLGINLLGLFIFGHSHSHNLPAIADEDEDDEECDESLKLIVTPNKSEIKNSRIEDESKPDPLVSDDVIIKSPNKKDLDKSKKKKKPTKCHILSSEANMNMRAVFLHVLADALGSVVVIISALLNIYQKQLSIDDKYIVYIDPVLSLILICLILASTIPLLKDSALILLQTVPKEIEIKKLKEDIVKKIPGILSVHELHVWKLSGNKIIATAHVTCHNSVEYMKIATDLKAFFHKKGIHSTTFQPEFTDPVDGGDNGNCILECNEKCNPNTCCGQTNTDKPGGANEPTPPQNSTEPAVTTTA